MNPCYSHRTRKRHRKEWVPLPSLFLLSSGVKGALRTYFRDPSLVPSIPCHLGKSSSFLFHAGSKTRKCLYFSDPERAGRFEAKGHQSVQCQLNPSEPAWKVHERTERASESRGVPDYAVPSDSTVPADNFVLFKYGISPRWALTGEPDSIRALDDNNPLLCDQIVGLIQYSLRFLLIQREVNNQFLHRPHPLSSEELSALESAWGIVGNLCSITRGAVLPPPHPHP